MVDVVKTTRGISDRAEKLFVLCQDEYVDFATADAGCEIDLAGFQRGHRAGAVADDCGAVFRRLHDDVFRYRFIDVGSRVVC